jgi:hypothetical protein
VIRSPAASDLPPELRPSASEGLRLLPGQTVVLAKCHPSFQRWVGPPVYSLGGKAILDVKGEPVYPELAILRLLERQGWRGVWINAAWREFRTGLPNQTAPVAFTEGPAAQLVQRVIKERGSYAGCPDVVAQRNGAVVLIAAKRRDRFNDRFKESQLNWIAAALDHDVPPACFLVVEWSVAAD